MTATLSGYESRLLLGCSFLSCAVIFQTFQGDGAPLVASIAFSGLAFTLTYSLTRWLGPSFIRAGLKGKDMSKKGSTEIPEAMGAVCAVVYLLIIIVFIPFPFYKDIVAATSGGGNRDLVIEVEDVDEGRYLHRFPHSKLASYLSAILSLQSVVILGVGDDLFDIRWRHKILIPAFASIPMLIVYFVDFGVTKVVIPTPLQPYLGELFDLGWIYYVYMSAVSIFCPNCINILAGINGIEVSQSILIAIFILVNDLIYLYPSLFNFQLSTYFAKSTASTLQPPPPTHPATPAHLLSIYLLLPFLGVSLALLTQNWYKARVFVGDTYCYFAGMVFAVVAIQGHFSKTLLLLLLPQIFNFVYSAPQLFSLIPCPRHRLPHFNAATELLEPSWVEFGVPYKIKAELADVGNADTVTSRSNLSSNGNAARVNGAQALQHARVRSGELLTIADTRRPPYSRLPAKPKSPHYLVQFALKLMHKTRLVRVQVDAQTGEVLRCTNLTLLNLWLTWFGPLREDRLALQILAMQAIFGSFGLWVRHRLALWVFSVDNL